MSYIPALFDKPDEDCDLILLSSLPVWSYVIVVMAVGQLNFSTLPGTFVVS